MSLKKSFIYSINANEFEIKTKLAHFEYKFINKFIAYEKRVEEKMKKFTDFENMKIFPNSIFIENFSITELEMYSRIRSESNRMEVNEISINFVI